MFEKFCRKKSQKKLLFLPPDLLHSLQSVTFSGAAPIVCSNQSDRTLSFYSINLSLVVAKPGLPSVNNVNDRNALTGRKIIYLTPILHLSVPDMCSMNAEKHTLFIYISGTYRVFLHIVHISYTYQIYIIYI
jgi:hypothetical protein